MIDQLPFWRSNRNVRVRTGVHLLATVHGFASVEPRLFEVSQVLRLSLLEVIWKIGLPNALPDALAGMRLSLTVAL